MTITVERYAGTPAEWDAFVRSRPDWTHFHLAGWRDVIGEVFGHECVYLAARARDGALAGVLPLVRVKSMMFGHYLVSMPFLNYGGPLGSDAAVAALVQEAVELARADGARLLELRSMHELPVPLPVSHRKLTVLLDLPPGDPDALWRGLGGKLRSQIRRPQKEGVTVRFGRDQLDAFYEVFSHHMRDLGTPTQSRRFFAAILDRFGDDVWVGTASIGDRPIAVGCGFRWRDEFEMTWASSLLAWKRLAPNMLLYWTFMERASREGVATFNFGRCSPGSGTHAFKRQWGSRDVPLWWYQHVDGRARGTPSPDDAAYAWGPRLWKRLPARVATALGPSIVRGIP